MIKITNVSSDCLSIVPLVGLPLALSSKGSEHVFKSSAEYAPYEFGVKGLVAAGKVVLSNEAESPAPVVPEKPVENLEPKASSNEEASSRDYRKNRK
jgi:hypothetical protein